MCHEFIIFVFLFYHLRLRCCCLPCLRRGDDAIIVEDNCCQCNYAALRRMVEIGEVEVFYATFHVDVNETLFFVVLDYTKKKVCYKKFFITFISLLVCCFMFNTLETKTIACQFTVLQWIITAIRYIIGSVNYTGQNFNQLALLNM